MRKRGDDNNPSGYQVKGEDQARNYLAQIGKRPGILAGEALRKVLDSLDGDRWFQTTMADFWLGLREDDGKRRRSIEPPKNPFSAKMAKQLKLRGKAQVARKSDIKQWHEEWVAREMLDAMVQDLDRRLDRASAETSTAIRQNLPMLIDQLRGVVGVVHGLPERAFMSTLDHTEQLEVKSLRLVDALRMRWIDDEERLYWIGELARANREEERELERLADMDRSAKQGQVIGEGTAPSGPGRPAGRFRL